MRPGLQALGAFLALFAAAAGATGAPAADGPLGDLVHPPKFKLSHYDEVAAADLVVRAKSKRPDAEGSGRYAVEETLKGRPGAEEIRVSPPPSPRDRSGAAALLALDRDGETWRPIGELDLRGERGEDAGASIELWRRYAGIAARPDRGERERALADLRRQIAEAARRGSRRFPAWAADDLDAHLHLPSPLQPFADLAELYWRSAREDERTAVLWALEESRHPEAPGFLAGLLTGGRDLGRELAPIAYDLAARGDEPQIAHLAAALGAESETAARRAGLVAFVRLAAPRDLDLAWRRLADVDVDRTWEALLLAPWLAEHTRPADLPARYRRLPARAKLALAAAAAAHPAETFLRGLVLAGDDPQGRSRRLSAAELARELAAAPALSPRRRAALLLAAASPEGGWRPRWWMLQATRGEEAIVLLAWFARHPPGADELLSLGREALAAGELDRALWAVAAAAPALLVPVVRQLDEEAAAAAPWLPARPASGDEWIESSYEAGAPAVGAVVLPPWIAAAGEADLPLVVRALSHADLRRTGLLLRYLVVRPAPPALPALRRLYDEPRLGRRALAEALSACGDEAVVEAGIELLGHRWNDADVAWALAVLARSTLPETGDRVRALEREVRDAMLRRYAETTDDGPLRRPVLEALLDGWTPAKDDPETAIRDLLERQVADGEDWVQPYLDRIPPPALADDSSHERTARPNH